MVSAFSVRKLTFFVFFLLITGCVLSGSISIVGKLTKRFEVVPGEHAADGIVVRNNNESPVDIEIYISDYLFSADGKVNFESPGTNPKSNARWISLDTQRVTIAPHSKKKVHFSISIPPREVRGSYWSLIMIEPAVRHKNPLFVSTKEENLNPVDNIRFGIQVITNIKGTGNKSVRFNNQRVITQENGKKMFQIEIENDGDVELKPSVSIEFFDQKGKFINRYDSPKKQIFPFCSVLHEADISKIPDGRYSIIVTADDDDSKVFGTRLSIELPGNPS